MDITWSLIGLAPDKARVCPGGSGVEGGAVGYKCGEGNGTDMGCPYG